MSKLHSILIVEDSDEDFEATRRAFQKSHLANPVYRCSKGEEALDFLLHRGKYRGENAPERPGIILLDLNLPGTDGRDVLHRIKRDEILRLIPVVVLTTSADERDIRACYSEGANSYVQKPVDLARFMEAIQRLKEYWFDVVILDTSSEKEDMLTGTLKKG